MSHHLHILPTAFTLQESVSEDVTLQFSNPNEVYVLYKIRSTTPERFIVRPRHGVVQPQKSENITIQLQQGVHIHAATKDQFQIEFRELGANEVVPKAAEIADRLRTTADGTKVSSQKRTVSCDLAPAPTSPLGAAFGGSQSAASITVSQGSDQSAAGGGATKVATPVTVASTEEKLDTVIKSIAQHRGQVADTQVMADNLEMKKQQLEAKNREDEVKIAQLQQKQKRDRAVEPVLVPWWITLVLMIGAVVLAHWYV